MKTTKTIITAIMLCFFAFANAQQKKEFTKEETLKYINDTYVKLHGASSNKFTLDNKVLVWTYLDGTTSRHDLMKKEPLEIVYCDLCTNKYRVFFKSDINSHDYIFGAKVESDVKRLKNALEHLIKLLKAEPETDPFAN